MKLANIIEKKREEIIRLSAKHGAKNIRVFGSVARGDESEDSDIDILVDLEKGRSLLDLSGLLIDLQKLLGRKVDVVTEKSLHWYIRDKILKEAREI
ncbi:MAG: nucleotidyltransferase family protein [Lascolabacillus sp.]|nr:nucleotidyltransferase family protein [Lascolabacillus sp.]